MPTHRFVSKEAYRKWNAYRHIHGIPAKHLAKVIIAGKAHKVKHSAATVARLRKRKKTRIT